MMVMLRASLCSIALCFLTIPSSAQSAEASNPMSITSMTIESFQQRVQALGFSTTRGSTSGKQDTFFTFMAEGRKVGGLIVNPAVIELFISFRDGAATDDLNEWNRTHYETAAFVDQNGNAVLRSDLVLASGVTEQNVDSFITRFRDIAGIYARFIIEHKKKPVIVTPKVGP